MSEELMTVYRIENIDGIGPYCHSGEAMPKVTFVWNRGCNHPVPESDGIYGATREHFYGFVSIRHMARWFGNLASLRRDDYWALVSYTVPVSSVIVGHSQVAFVKAHAVANDMLV